MLDADARFIGGVIAPGPDALANALHHRTALLPLLAFPAHAYSSPAPPALGQSTQEALRAAAFHGWRGMVKEIIAAICAEQSARLGFPSDGDCTARLKIVATGGVAARLAQDVPELQRVDPDLALDGLRVIAAAGGLSTVRRPRPGGLVSASETAADDADASPGGERAALPDEHTLPLAGLDG